MSSDFIWYKSKQQLKIGGVSRYRVRFTSTDPDRSEIFLRVKNTEKTSLRAIHLLNGPFILYCHVVPANYHHRTKFEQGLEHSKEIVFRNSVKPGQTFNVTLRLNKNSLVEEKDGAKTYEWYCDVISQIVLNRRASINFVLVVGDDLPKMRLVTRSTLTNLSKGEFQTRDDTWNDEWEAVVHPGLQVTHQSAEDIWNKEHDPDRPVHLVIVTHGLFSNLTADMLYLRDRISKILGENIVVEGYRGNAGRTERGIHRLGLGVSNYTTDLIAELQKKGSKVESISFVAHSLGGPVQLYALKHILQVHGTDYFERNNIRLRHFVCMASPMLGILSEMSLWISWFLDLGTLGKTGRDLTLLKKLPHYSRNADHRHGLFRPLLETLPDEPVHTLLKQFELRTVYANAVNDGIVPLRTSALLYLDWEALGDVTAMKKEHKTVHHEATRALTETNASGHDVGEIPADSESDFGHKYSDYLASMKGQNSHEKKRKKVSKRVRRYAKINAKSSDRTESDDEDEDGDGDGEEDESAATAEEAHINIPPKASAVESAFSTFLCPIPSEKYIVTPETRVPVIFHDKYYHFRQIPPEEGRRTGGIFKFFQYTDWRMDKQVKIARKYHAPELSWRKVLVCLPPDAHNNIVVRRRFANGYGWGVVDHLTDEVFTNPQIRAKM